MIATAAAAAGMLAYVAGRMIGAGELLAVATAGTYICFTGMAALAALVLLSPAPRAVTQVLGIALFLYGAVLVSFPFSRSAAAALAVLIAVIVACGAITWRDLAAARAVSPSVEHRRASFALNRSAAWIPIAAVAATYFALGDFSPTSAYMTEWLAIAGVLVAVAGRTNRWAAIAVALGAAADAATIGATSVAQIAAGNPHRTAYLLAALIVAGMSAVQIWRIARKTTQLDPVQLMAIQLAVALTFRWAFYLGSGLGLDPSTYPGGYWQGAFRAELPLLAMAFAAIGLGLTRPVGPALRRLALSVPTVWNVLLALALADVYRSAGRVVSRLTYALMPHAYWRIGEIQFKTDYSLPMWALLAYGFLAGISEEALFRGAVQPRVGIALTAVLFTTIHIQYGLTPDLALVFTAGIAYGFVRKHINLTTAVIAHAATDTGGFPSGSWLVTLLWLTVLLAVIAYAIARRRASARRSTGGKSDADRTDDGLRVGEDVGRDET